MSATRPSPRRPPATPTAPGAGRSTVPVAAAGAAAPADEARLRAATWRYLRVLGCDAALADDLTQEAFVVALRRGGLRALGAEVAGDDPDARRRARFAFLRTTARHLYLKSRRRKAALREVEQADRVWDERCGAGDGDDRLDALRACLRALPERSRQLLAATYGDGDGRAAAGRRVGLGAHGVKSALRRLRAFLHDCIAARLQQGEPR